MRRILLVEDKESLGRMLRETLMGEGLEIDWAQSGTEAVRRLAHGTRYAAVITDLRLPGSDGIEILRKSKENDPDCPVIVMTGFGTIENAVEAMKLGAFDFIQKPFDVDHLVLLIRRCRELRDLKSENIALKDALKKTDRFPAIVGDSPEIRNVSAQIEKVAPTDSTVLLEGESGTGKELYARAIHQLSPRAQRPFVAINCAAIPDTLLENELFGHEKGAYTGAAGRQLGRFEVADTGTIFLDEIGELGIGVQSKLLRVLQERRFERVGGATPIEVDIRIVCATNKKLSDAVRAGRFREDLFFRINVFPIVIPPLRMRKSDLRALTDHFLGKFGRELGRGEMRLTAAAEEALRGYDWPGNVRELENCLERAVILADHDSIDVKDLNIALSIPRTDAAVKSCLDFHGTLAEVSARATATVERIKIADALSQSKSRADAAEKLGISPRLLAAKMREYGLDEEQR